MALKPVRRFTKEEIKEKKKQRTAGTVQEKNQKGAHRRFYENKKGTKTKKKKKGDVSKKPRRSWNG